MGCFPSHGSATEEETKTPTGAAPGAVSHTETPSAVAAASTTATVPPIAAMPTAPMDHHPHNEAEASAATLPGRGLVNALSPTVARILSISAPHPDSAGPVAGNPIKRGGEEALHHLRNIFAAPISFALGATGFRMPHYPKSDVETSFLQKALHNHYLFESQPESSVAKLIAAFEMCTLTTEDPRAQPAPDHADQFLVPFIHQGEEVTLDTAYFYVLYHGRCQFLVDDALVGWAEPGDSFGELALLYDGPRAATVTAVLERAAQDAAFPDHTVVLFRVHQRSFRLILQQEDQDADNAKMKLLDGIDFLTHASPQVKANLAAVMTPFPFNKGDFIVHKGAMDLPWTVIERGTVRAANLDMGYQDFIVHPGQCFGERAIVKGDPAIGDAIAESAGVAFTVDQETFRSLIGNLDDIILRAQDCVKLKAIAVLSDATQCDDRVLGYLSRLLVDQSFAAGEVICQEGQPLQHPAALYLVRKGSVRIESSTDQNEPSKIVEVDGFFGEDQLKADTEKAAYMSPYTATVVESCTCGVLKLRDCRNVLNTRRIGEGNVTKDFDSLAISGSVDGSITMKDLRVHRMLGAGTFGQVHLVSRIASDGVERPYALKVQSKYELCQSGQAKGVVREKNLMALFHSPFVARLFAAFQDDKCVYMLMNLLQGGELYSVMHTATTNVLSEEHAKFYSACVAEALFYLHCSHSLVFRDLKPENVMIDERGYAILIDFGFCKKISGKTYTTCGTPLYLAPEVILNRGHSWSVDHWSLGVMIYEMLVGNTPFYKPGMGKADLFRNIVQGKVYPPSDASPEALSLLSGLLRRDPAKRLGSLGGSEVDIIEHPSFQGIDRDLLFMKEVKPPFIPQIKDPFDSSNFSDDWKHVEDKRRAHYPKLNAEDAAIFEAF